MRIQKENDKENLDSALRVHREVVEVLLDVQDDPEAAERPGVSGVEPGAVGVRVERVAHSQVGHGDVE